MSKRLAALGALTKGERHSLFGELFRVEDVTDSYQPVAKGEPSHGEQSFSRADTG